VFAVKRKYVGVEAALGKIDLAVLGSQPERDAATWSDTKLEQKVSSTTREKIADFNLCVDAHHILRGGRPSESVAREVVRGAERQDYAV
jgi:hypothetical protein